MLFVRRPIALLFLVGSFSLNASQRVANEDDPQTFNPGPTELAKLNLTPVVRQSIDDRELVVQYEMKHFQVAAGMEPTPRQPVLRSNTPMEDIQWVVSKTDSANLGFRRALSETAPIPLRGFTAPILQSAGAWKSEYQIARSISPKEQQAETLIDNRIAYDGLLPTLTRVLKMLGPEAYTNPVAGSLARLDAIGFPTDLLACFAPEQLTNGVEASSAVIARVARRLVEGADPDQLSTELDSLPFHVPAQWLQFQIAPENGVDELGLVRLQAGGGYSAGIVPGDCMDVIGQLVRTLPQPDYMVSVPNIVALPVKYWAVGTLPLTRHNQLKMIEEPYRVKAWAQDNGKPGFSRDPKSNRQVYSVLTPRFASRCEGYSSYLPGESFLMDGLKTAGLRIIHSHLLFQGGNAWPVIDPDSGERTLFVGEGLVARNVALGLTRIQVIEALKQVFGVDRCVPVPPVSYHLDFDVSFRTVEGRFVAFVNDPAAAARRIVQIGIDALANHKLIQPDTATALRTGLTGSNEVNAVHQLAGMAKAHLDPNQQYASDFSAVFRTSHVDSAAGNLQVFLQALDLLEAAATMPEALPDDPDRYQYLSALRRMNQARLVQLAALRAAGAKLVDVPSMPNLFRSINYLNGIQYKGGYVMPAFGGFYSALDDAAESAFRQNLEPGAQIHRIQCAELQRKNGAIHCATSAFPLFPDPYLHP